MPSQESDRTHQGPCGQQGNNRWVTKRRKQAHVTDAHHLPTSHRGLQNELSIRVCVSQKSSCCQMFHRNLLSVFDPLHRFPTTLVTESGTTCADLRGGPRIGRMAEQSLPSQKVTSERIKQASGNRTRCYQAQRRLVRHSREHNRI